MEQNEPFQRDKKGDVIIDYTKINNDLRAKDHIYTFYFKNKEGYFHEYGEENWKKYMPKSPNIKLVAHHIFKSPEPYDPKLTDAWIINGNTYDFYLNKYFRPIFSETHNSSNRPLRMRWTQLIMPQEKLEAIKSFVTEYKLQQHEDFLFFLIAMIEKVYVKEVASYDSPYQRTKIRNFPKEVDKLIEIIKRNKKQIFHYKEGKPHINLEAITFAYNRETPIAIKDDFLINLIVDAIEKDLEDNLSTDWEGFLKNLKTGLYSENKQPNEFRPRVTNALHNFFKAMKAFNFGGNETTDTEMYAIGQILDFANVKFYDNKEVEMNFITHKKEVKQRLRVDLKRKKLEYQPTHFSSEEVQPNIEMLQKYFDNTFLKSFTGNYEIQNLGQVITLTNRFNVPTVLHQLAYISNCLGNYRFIIGHQLDAHFTKAIEQNKDYHSLKTLLNSLKSGGRMTELSFKLENNTESFGFNERLPLELLEQALLDYYKKNQADFQVDLYESDIEIVTHREFSVPVSTGKLRDPKDRFMSAFTKQCYNFLNSEAPYKEHDPNPSFRYFGVIKGLLSISGYLNFLQDSEIFMDQKVRYWYNL